MSNIYLSKGLLQGIVAALEYVEGQPGGAFAIADLIRVYRTSPEGIHAINLYGDPRLLVNCRLGSLSSGYELTVSEVVAKAFSLAEGSTETETDFAVELKALLPWIVDYTPVHMLL